MFFYASQKKYHHKSCLNQQKNKSRQVNQHIIAPDHANVTPAHIATRQQPQFDSEQNQNYPNDNNKTKNKSFAVYIFLRQDNLNGTINDHLEKIEKLNS